MPNPFLPTETVPEPLTLAVAAWMPTPPTPPTPAWRSSKKIHDHIGEDVAKEVSQTCTTCLEEFLSSFFSKPRAVLSKLCIAARDKCLRVSKLPPIVSVIIPTRNRPAMLAEAIASARAQTFSDYEIIVVSNGEDKDKRQASREVAAAHGCTYLQLDEGNVSAARNAGIERAQGQWIAVLDDDDLWKPEKLEAQLAAAGDADAVFSDYETVHANGARNIGLTRPPRDGMTIEEGFLLRNYAGGAASNALLRRHAVLSVGGFDRHLEASEDWDLWRRLSQAADIIFIPDILSMRRQHQSNISQQQIKMILGKVRVYRKNLQSLPWHLEHMRWRIRFAMLKCLVRLAAAPIYWSGLRPRARLNALAGREIFKW